MLNKCEKCGEEDAHEHMCTYDEDRFKLGHQEVFKIYYVCWKCYLKWYYDGYDDIWFSLVFDVGNIELANKLALDFLGKLD